LTGYSAASRSRKESRERRTNEIFGTGDGVEQVGGHGRGWMEWLQGERNASAAAD